MRKRRSVRGAGILARGAILAAAAGAAATAAAIAAPAPAAGQQQERRECRCVDASGEEIEDCRCFRLPEMNLDRGFALALGGAQARIGVMVGGEEGEEDPRGVVLRDVVDGSPAEEAGLREGDVVTRVDGRSVLEPLEDEEERELDPAGSAAVQRFIRLVRRLEPGEEVPVEYIRDGETLRTTVVPERSRGFFGAVSPEGVFFHDDPGRELDLGGRGFFYEREGEGPLGVWSFGEGERPFGVLRLGEGEGGVRMLGRGLDPCVSLGSDEGSPFIAGSRCVDGLHLQELGPQLAEYFGVEEGVLVIEVAEDAALGLRAGDVIRAIDGREVQEVGDVRRILRSYEDDEPIELTVVRQGETLAVRGTRR